jgi:sulfur carrier protein ThiS
MARIRFHLSLQEYSGSAEREIMPVLSVSLHGLLDQWGIPANEVGIVIRNGRWTKSDCMLEKDDVVDVFPLLSGG